MKAAGMGALGMLAWLMSVPLGTMRYGELVAMIYAPIVVALLGVSVAAVRYRMTRTSGPRR